MTDKNYNRWYPVCGAVLIQLCIGIVYIWSIFRAPLEQKFGWSTSDISLAFSINVMMIPIMMIVGGLIMQKAGPRVVAILGGVLVLIGMFITSKATELWMLWLGYGIFTGGGVGVAYGVPIATLVKWFPDKRGLITGLAVGALGFGSILFAQVGYFFMGSIGLMETFVVLGIIIFVGVMLGALLMKPAPDGYAPPGWTPPAAKSTSIRSSHDFTPREMLRTPQYYSIFLMYVFICICALGMLGHASPIGQSIAHLTPLEASTIVSLLGLFNSGGRIVMGGVSDKFGRMRSLCLLFILTGVAMLVMQYMDTYILYAFAAGAVAFSFGGSAGIFPSITADVFGPKYVGINYGIVLLAYGLGGIAGPVMIARIKESTGGDYSMAFIIGAIVCALGIVLTVVFKPAKQPGASLLK
jgi:OFA family oxalate/formate antiporter-like MFS transporter